VLKISELQACKSAVLAGRRDVSCYDEENAGEGFAEVPAGPRPQSVPIKSQELRTNGSAEKDVGVRRGPLLGPAINRNVPARPAYHGNTRTRSIAGLVSPFVDGTPGGARKAWLERFIYPAAIRCPTPRVGPCAIRISRRR